MEAPGSTYFLAQEIFSEINAQKQKEKDTVRNSVLSLYDPCRNGGITIVNNDTFN